MGVEVPGSNASVPELGLERVTYRSGTEVDTHMYIQTTYRSGTEVETYIPTAAIYLAYKTSKRYVVLYSERN